jgi:hypothetical protein
MKTILISAALAVFISEPAFSRVVMLSPTVQLHGAKAFAEDRAAQLDSRAPGGVASCSTKYVTTTRGDGSSTTRQSVNCEE